MKISFVINEPVQDATGGYKMVYMYANSFVQAGHEVSIYYWCRRGRLFTNYRFPFFVKMKIACYLAKKGPKWFELDKRIKGIAVKKITNMTIDKTDVVIATAVNTATPVYNLDINKGKKAFFIQDFENWEISDVEVCKTYSLGMKNIVVSNWLKEIVDKYSINESVVISNGIDTSIFHDEGKERDNHSLVLQYRKTAYKGPEYSLDAIVKLNKLYPDLSVSMISVDEPPINLPSCCKYYQSISPDKVAEINNLSNVFICTSIKEGYGLPGLEAMACGCVVCSSAYQGVFEYAIDRENALLSPIKDVDAMVKNICKVFDNRDIREKLITKSKITSADKSQNKMAELFINVLMELCYE